MPSALRHTSCLLTTFLPCGRYYHNHFYRGTKVPGQVSHRAGASHIDLPRLLCSIVCLLQRRHKRNLGGTGWAAIMCWSWHILAPSSQLGATLTTVGGLLAGYQTWNIYHRHHQRLHIQAAFVPGETEVKHLPCLAPQLTLQGDPQCLAQGSK